ncbi:MAG: hypothetical protein QS98_C0012G0046 [archaeon GW2011_AR3]|nr:MAG: hypothetical protein QS98_C0012G0046 [archaeon GW2011_AR3]
MKKILLDTNMLMSIGALKVDIFSEIERICDFRYELVTIDSVVVELSKLTAPSRGNIGRTAKLALELIKRKNVKILKSGIMPADEGIVMVADTNFIVATQDLALKRRLKAKGAGIITIRQKKYLKFG